MYSDEDRMPYEGDLPFPMLCETCKREDAMGSACQGGKGGCAERNGGWGLHEYPLASVYAPLQSWRRLYDCETALQRGTLFEELDLPFVCGEMNGGKCHG